MINVAYITADWGGGAGWHRCQLPADMINRHATNIRAVVAPGYCIQQTTRRIWPIGLDKQPIHPATGDTWDIIVLQRIMFADTATKIRAARHDGQIVINDLDDWYWGLATSNSAWQSTHPRNNPNEHRGHYWKALAASTHITVSTRNLADRIARLDVPTTIIANTIPTHLYTPQPVRDRPPVIGWVGHTSFRSGDLETLRGIIGPFIRRHNLTFHHGGHSAHGTPVAALLDIPAEHVTTTPACAPDQYPQLWDGIDIAVAPLADTPFNHAKTWVKAGEAAAAGVPIICADLTPYQEWGASPLARRPRDWTRHLTSLLDPTQRAAVQTRQTERVATETPDRRWTDWAHLYQRLAGQR